MPSRRLASAASSQHPVSAPFRTTVTLDPSSGRVVTSTSLTAPEGGARGDRSRRSRVALLRTEIQRTYAQVSNEPRSAVHVPHRSRLGRGTSATRPSCWRVSPRHL